MLAPYFYTLGQADLIAYFTGLADRSRKPLYLYDLPGVTRTSLHLETVLQLSKHANIRGIKCSGEWTETRRLMDHVGEGFRVVPVQPNIVDMLVRCGVRNNLDGIFAVLPDLTADRRGGRTRRLPTGGRRAGQIDRIPTVAADEVSLVSLLLGGS